MTQLLAAPATGSDPQPRRWTREEFYRMAEIGLFHGQRAELLEGEIVVLSPQNPAHFSTTQRVAIVLHNVFGAGFHVRQQGPIELGPQSEPEPDVAVVPGEPDDYVTRHPQSALLIVEVSESTLWSDRNRKCSLYARAGVADYWIVNLVNRQLEVHRSPTPDPTQAYGHRYANQTILTLSDTVSPLAAPTAVLSVSDLFPPQPPNPVNGHQ